jgi:hypothetical protein
MNKTAMKPTKLLTRWGAQLLIERPARKLTFSELIAQLEQSGKQMTERLAACPDTPPNRRQLCHVIGMERWGQRRLRVALGEPFLTEEYDHYRPSNERPWDELNVEWDSTRQSILALANDLSQTSIPVGLKIPHNQFGPLSVKGWLRYLDVHASSEGKRIK